MARITLSVLLGLVAAVSGSVTIPADQPNGVYSVTYDDQGNAVHNLISRSAAAAPGPMRVPAKRDYGIFCSAAVLPSNNILQAQNALGSACDQGGDSFIGGYGSGPGIRYAKFDTVVAYVCNYSGNPQHCSSSEINSDFSQIEATCPGTAGWFSHYNDWKKSYGFDDAANSICG